jgi:hypothetical protein
MAWIFLLPCILAAFFSASYYDAVVPIGYLFVPTLIQSEFGRLPSIIVTGLIFLTFTYFANGKSYALHGRNRWAWFPLIGNFSLAIADLGDAVFQIKSLGFIKLPLLIALIIITVLAAINSKSKSPI